MATFNILTIATRPAAVSSSAAAPSFSLTAAAAAALLILLYVCSVTANDFWKGFCGLRFEAESVVAAPPAAAAAHAAAATTGGRGEYSIVESIALPFFFHHSPLNKALNCRVELTDTCTRRFSLVLDQARHWRARTATTGPNGSSSCVIGAIRS
jgi:hypothetical protein